MHRLSSRANGSAHRRTLMYVNSLSAFFTAYQISSTDVNLQGALFVPLYATPRSTPDALNIVFKGDKSHGSAMSLSFLKLKGMKGKGQVLGILFCLLTKSNLDLLDFQQAVSGYKVAYDE